MEVTIKKVYSHNVNIGPYITIIDNKVIFHPDLTEWLSIVKSTISFVD